jgi:hypothetical protein
MKGKASAKTGSKKMKSSTSLKVKTGKLAAKKKVKLPLKAYLTMNP